MKGPNANFSGRGKWERKKMIFYHQGTPTYNQLKAPLGNKKRMNDKAIKRAAPSNGLQKDRTNGPMIPDKKNSNKREGGMSDLAILVSQQLNPKPSRF